MRYNFFTKLGRTLAVAAAVLAVGAVLVGSPVYAQDVSGGGGAIKSVKIGEQTWMAQNLNVKTMGSWCYDNKEANCTKCGRLYTWEAAKKACPKGWHLPSRDELGNLLQAVGGVRTQDKFGQIDWEDAGKKLKSKTGWKNTWEDENGNGTDNFGFSALSCGERSYNDNTGCNNFHDAGFSSTWWFVPVAGSGDTLRHWVVYNSSDVVGEREKGIDEDYGYSVRCLKD